MVLVPHFAKMAIYLHPVHMGGNVKLETVINEIGRLAYNHGYVTTMYDFYGFKGLDVGETKNSLEAKIKQRIDQNVTHKVFPYIQMYEFEGLLFASPLAIKNHVKAHNNADVGDWAQDVVKTFNNLPETINNSRQTAPSKRLQQYTDYKKTIDGPNIAREIGLIAIRNACPHFNHWITMIEGWA